MKKVTALLAVLLLAGPAFSADWSFYGSQRMATFWDHNDAGDGTLNGRNNDDDLIWDFQSNSRIGAKVAAGRVSGVVELALSSENTHDGAVLTRRAFGEWSFMDGAKLKIGKDYTPTSQLISGQAFDADNGMLGIGTIYARRPGQVAVQFGGLELALIQPNSTTRVTYPGDTDEYLPKIEAAYTAKFDLLAFKVSGGFQTFRVEDNGGAVTEDLDITAYIIGADVNANLGRFYVKAAGSFGQNWGNARWNDLGYTSNTNSAAVLNAAGDDVKDCTSWMAALIAGMKLTDALKFEAGAGFRSDDNDAARHKDQAWNAYLQAVYTLAPGVTIVPEIGYFDYRDNPAGADEGYEWYAGAKWQIDF